MRDDVERIEFPDSSWWEIHATVTRGMRKAFRKAGVAGFAKGLRNGAELDLTDADAMRRAVMAHPDAWDLDAVDDAYLLYGTIGWSWPELVTPETLDARDNAVVAQVLSRMQQLYAEIPEEARKNA